MARWTRRPPISKLMSAVTYISIHISSSYASSVTLLPGKPLARDTQTSQVQRGVRGRSSTSFSRSYATEESIVKSKAIDQRSFSSGSRIRLSSNLPTTSSPPRKLEASPIDLTPPGYCERGLLGQPVKPAKKKLLLPPSDATARMILDRLGQERPCMLFTRECAHLLWNNSVPLQPHQWFPGSQAPGVDRRGVAAIMQILFRGFPREEAAKLLPDLHQGQLGTCAVVGNGDNLLQERRGAEIDRHDFVLRFNVKMAGFEDYVGTKTDGLWTKPNYDASPYRGTQVPTQFHVCPKDRTMQPKQGVPILPYGPSLKYWRPVANAIYAAYKEENRMTKGKPTGARLQG